MTGALEQGGLPVKSWLVGPLSLSILLFAAAAGRAIEDEGARNRVGFDVQASRDVPNDWVKGRIGVTAENADAAALADEVNRHMAWALEIARATAGVEVKSGGYSTHQVMDPRAKDQRIWRAQQDLVLESSDVRALSELVGRLQNRLQLRSLEFSVSDEKREEVEAELIDEALELYKLRADRVRKRLGASGYALVRLDIGTSAGRPMPPPRPMMRSMAAEATVAPPALEGGSSRLVVGIHAAIELD